MLYGPFENEQPIQIKCAGNNSRRWNLWKAWNVGEQPWVVCQATRCVALFYREDQAAAQSVARKNLPMQVITGLFSWITVPFVISEIETGRRNVNPVSVPEVFQSNLKINNLAPSFAMFFKLK